MRFQTKATEGLVFASLLLLVSGLSLSGGVPHWWLSRGVVEPGSSQSDFAPANLGQAKWMAKQAMLEMNEIYAQQGGSGAAIASMVSGFVTVTDLNYAPLNIGQLKAMAKPFYDRLIALGYDTSASLRAKGAPGWAYDYPWTPQTWDDSNYSVALIGQLKWVFSFDFGWPSWSRPEFGHGVPEWWLDEHFGGEHLYGGYFDLFALRVKYLANEASPGAFSAASAHVNWAENPAVNASFSPVTSIYLVTPTGDDLAVNKTTFELTQL